MSLKDIFEDFFENTFLLHLLNKNLSDESKRRADNRANLASSGIFFLNLVDDEIFQGFGSKHDFRVNKDDEKSIEYRKEGNRFFSLKNEYYFDALHMYNKSICFAENDSENLSIGYANRSAVLFECYKECLENIKLAKEANYPERLMNKLHKREENCLALLETQKSDPVQYEFKLTYGRHKTIPFIADCLDMKYEKNLGRYVYTKKDLNPGDLISIENPFSSILLPPNKYERCANCLKENYLTLIPCPDCTCVMFCSKECMKEGFKVFHKYECPIIDLLHGTSGEGLLIALRTSLKVLSLFETIDECIEFCNSPDNQNQCAFTLNYNNFTMLEYYRAIHGLETNQDKRTGENLNEIMQVCVDLIKHLLNKTLLGELLIDENHQKFLIDLLLRHVLTSSASMHAIDSICERNGKKDNKILGAGSYAFGSLFNHSCAPNTMTIYQGTTQLIFVLRPIPANQQLFQCYVNDFAKSEKLVRQRILKTHWNFICQCEACVNNYPRFINLPTPKDVPINMRDFELLKLCDREYAMKNYKRYFRYLKEYRSFYPCQQLQLYRAYLYWMLNILANNTPLKIRMTL